MASTSIPEAGRLPPSLRVPSASPAVQKILSRLSRASLIKLALEWLEDRNQTLTAPYLRHYVDEDADDLYPAAGSLEELREEYEELSKRKGSKKEVVDRIVEGDWRDGLTLYQLAMADLQYLYDRPNSQRWTAYRVVTLQRRSADDDEEDAPTKVDKKALAIPRFHPSTFLQRLQSIILPDVKVHYNLDRPKNLPVLVLRVFMIDSPYTTSLALSGLSRTTAAQSGTSAPASDFDAASRTLYVVFPDASPHVYISKSEVIAQAGGASGETGAGGGGAKSLRAMLIEGIPRALSRPQQRLALKSTSLTSNNLRALLERRGSGRTNSAGGGWASVYADESKAESPLDLVLPSPPPSEEGEAAADEPSTSARKRPAAVASAAEVAAERAAKRRRIIASARFGDSAMIADGKGLERVDVMIEDAYPAAPTAARSRPRHTTPTGPEPDSAPAASTDDVGKRGRRSSGRRSTLDTVFTAEAEESSSYDVDSGRGRGPQITPDGRHKGQRENDEEDDAWHPAVRVTFTGTHVFAGIRTLVEAGVVDGERMPGWMTGEEGVSIGVVRNGRIRGNKGSGV